MRWFSKPIEVPHRLRAIVRARESSVIVLALIVGALAGLVVAAMGEAVGLMHLTFFGLDPGERLSGRGIAQPVLRLFHPLPRRAAVRPRHRLYHPPARHRGRPGRSQCAARRAHVVARQPDRGGADGVVERRRRLGRPGGRLYPARQRHRLQDRAGLSPAPQRHAHPGRLRRRRGHRRRLRRALGRRLLRLRADHRQLFDRLAGAGRHGGAGRLPDRADLRARPARHRDRRGLEPGGA